MKLAMPILLLALLASGSANAERPPLGQVLRAKVPSGWIEITKARGCVLDEVVAVAPYAFGGKYVTPKNGSLDICFWRVDENIYSVSEGGTKRITPLSDFRMVDHALTLNW